MKKLLSKIKGIFFKRKKKDTIEVHNVKVRNDVYAFLTSPYDEDVVEIPKKDLIIE